MKKILLFLSLLALTFTSYSQSNKIIGSWIMRDSIEAMQFFMSKEGTILERSGLANENIWTKASRTGTYTFNDKGKLVITWSNKTIENREVKFEDHFKVAKLTFTDKKPEVKKTYLFLRIVDEEVLPGK